MLFLLLVLGAELSLDNVRKQWKRTVIGGMSTIVAVVLSFVALGWVFAIPVNQALFFGTTVSLSSTAVVMKCLDERDREAFHVQWMIGILVLQDVVLGGNR